jgi:hypothetical protein
MGAALVVMNTSDIYTTTNMCAVQIVAVNKRTFRSHAAAAIVLFIRRRNAAAARCLARNAARVAVDSNLAAVSIVNAVSHRGKRNIALLMTIVVTS